MCGPEFMSGRIGGMTPSQFSLWKLLLIATVGPAICFALLSLPSGQLPQVLFFAGGGAAVCGFSGWLNGHPWIGMMLGAVMGLVILAIIVAVLFAIAPRLPAYVAINDTGMSGAAIRL
jgi:hypothetical protein